MIYVPYGKLTIIGDNVNLNNVCIIANEIFINAKYNVNITSNNSLIEFVNDNATYGKETKNFIYASGNIKDNILTIKWNTNIKTKCFNIYDSSDNINFSKVQSVENANKCNIEISDDFTTKYYIVEANEYRSMSFKVTKQNGHIYIEENDNDGDKIPDAIEEIYGTDKNSIDSDGDGLSDYDEIMIVGTNPLKIDSDENGINDYDDDNDQDKISNGDEISLGTSPTYNDTDLDSISDYDEVYIFKTNPLVKDTDKDKANDGWEVENGTNPLIFYEIFKIFASAGEVSKDDPVCASVYIKSGNINPESLKIDRIMPHDNVYISPMVAGYLGDGFDFSIEGTFDTAKLEFKYDKSLGKISDEFQPRIYYFNENTKMFEELENQTVEDGKVTAITTHFSTYVLLNKTEFDKVWENDIKAAAEDNNLNVSLVVDLSGSMYGSKLSTTKSVINSFIDALEENDESALVSFTDRAILRCSFTKDKTQIKNSVNNMSAYGLTSIYTGIERALVEFETNKISGYKIMIVFTDGYDEPSTTYDGYYKDLVERAKNDNVIIYTIGIGTIDQQLLTRVAEGTGGNYYYANVVSNLQEKIDNIEKQTHDLTTDTNNDGINDYYTEKIKRGELVLSNGSSELKGIDLNYNCLNELSDDWDGDGIKNGDEIKVVTQGDKTYLKMNSHPLRVHSDLDAIDDATEVKRGADSLVDSILESPVQSLMTNSMYAYESYANDMRYDNFTQYSIGYSSFISGVWNKHEVYRDLLIDYYANYVSQDVIDAAELNECKKSAYDLLMQILPNVGTNYGMASNINVVISYLNGTRKVSKFNRIFNQKVANLITEFDKLSQDGKAISFEVNGDKYIPKYISHENATKLAKGLDKLSNGLTIAVSGVDVIDTYYNINKINANHMVFIENMDALSALSKFEYSKNDISYAANDLIRCIGGEYANVLATNIVLDGLDILENIGTNIIAMNIPYVNVVMAVRNALITVTGVKEDVEQMYRMLCYSDLSKTYIGLFQSKTVESENTMYYETEQFNNCIRYLTNIAQIRILGEKEQYYFYKNDGIFGGVVNFFSGAE